MCVCVCVCVCVSVCVFSPDISTQFSPRVGNTLMVNPAVLVLSARSSISCSN